MRRRISLICSADGCSEPRSSRKGLFCTRHRYLMERYGSTDDPRVLKPCRWCGKTYMPSQAGTLYCSAECRVASTYAPRCAIQACVCELCGATFVARRAGGKRARFCGSGCRAEAKRVYERARARAYREEHGEWHSQKTHRESEKAQAAKKERDRKRDQVMSQRARYPDQAAARDHRRRARLAGVPSEPFLRSEVFDRDGWVCQLCGEPVDRLLRWPDKGSPSLDHKVPVSKGGSNTRDNVQLAHLGCNVLKGDRVEVA